MQKPLINVANQRTSPSYWPNRNWKYGNYVKCFKFPGFRKQSEYRTPFSENLKCVGISMFDSL